MDWQHLLVAIVAAVVAAFLVYFLFRSSLERALDARLDRLSSAAAGQLAMTREETGVLRDAHRTHDDRFAEIAAELIDLARAATESVVRSAEVHEWHRPNMALGADDVAAVIRDKLRRASFNAVAARSQLVGAMRRHAASLPQPIESDLRAFCAHLDGNGDASSVEHRRRLADELEKLETRFRDALG